MIKASTGPMLFLNILPAWAGRSKCSTTRNAFCSAILLVWYCKNERSRTIILSTKEAGLTQMARMAVRSIWVPAK